MVQNFDKTKEYEDTIYDLVNKLRIACNRLGMPMFVSVCVKNNEKETVYKSEMVSAVSSDITLTEDKIVDFVNVINGFTTVPTRDTMDFDDLYDW